MTPRAATRCWGLALAVGTAVPLIAQTKSPASQKLPPVPAYEFGWSAPIGASDPSHLVVDGSTVLVSTGDDLRAFDAATGTQRWTLDLAHIDALVAGDGVTLAVTPGHVDAFDSADGHRRWSSALPSGEHTNALLDAKTLYVTTDLELRVYLAETGARLWQQTFTSLPTAIAADGDNLFVGLINHTLITLDVVRHEKLMEMPIETGPAELLATHGRVFICGADGALYSYRQRHSGGYSWRVLRVNAVGRPVADDRNVYVAQFDNTARAYGVGNGTERWRLRLDARPQPGTQLAAGRVYFPLLSGAVASATLRTKDGQPATQIPIVTAAKESDQLAYRLEFSAVSHDATRLFRVIRPASYKEWALLAVRQKEKKN